MDKKKLKFSVDSVKISDGLDTSRFASLRIECFATGDNAHDIVISEEALKGAEDTIFNIPIVWYYDGVFDDAGGHNVKEVPCGFIPKESSLSYEVQDDGRVMFVIDGALIWKKYTGKLMDIFEREGGKKNVSVEISIGNYDEPDNGVMELIDYSYEAVTILGELYTPAIPGANAEITEFAEKETREFKSDFKKEFLFSRKDYLEVDFSVPKEVKEVILDGISMMEDNDIEVDSVILRYSDHMYENEFVSPKKATYIRKHSERFRSEIDEEKIDKNYVSWMLLGGSVGNTFLSDTVSKMEEIDNRIMNYFDLYGKEEESMTKKVDKTEIDNEKDVDEVVVEEEVFAEEKKVEATEEVFEDASKEEDDDDAMMAEESKDEDKEDEEDEDFESKDDMKEEMADEEKEDKDEEFSDEDKKDEEKAEFGLNSSQMYEVLADALSGDCSYLEAYDESFAYIYDWMDEGCFRVPYSIAENKATLDMGAKEKVIRGGYELVGSGKEQFSLNSYLDVSAMLAFLESETEDYEEMSKINEEFSVASSAGKLMKAMFEMIQSDKQSIKDLTEFKEGVEKSQFAYEVETTINEVREFMTKADVDSLKTDSENYSLEDIDGWKNAVKAAAFEGKRKASENEEEDEIKGFSLPFDNAKGKNETGFWE